MKLFKNLFILFLLLLPAQQLWAQIEDASKTRTGSFYSLFGLGYPSDNNTSRELGLGIIGVSLDNMDSNTLQNPALWGKNAFTTATASFGLSKFNTKSSTQSNTNALLEAGHFQTTFPLMRDKLGASLSLYSVTRSNYRFVTIDSTVISPGNVVNYASDIRGSGGINKIEFGFGWNINKNIAVGYAPALTFVTENSSQDVFFDQADYRTSKRDSRISGAAIGHRFGALLTFRRLLSSRDRISIGASATLPVTIKGKERITVTKVVNNRDQVVKLQEPEKGDISLPLELKGGFTYYPSGLYNISLEGLYEQWSDYDSPFSSPNELAMMSDRVKLGLGGEFHPYRMNSSNFFTNFRYSAGLSYDSGHLTMQDQDINTLWFSAGLGIISPRSRSSIDLSIRYGIRGTTEQNLIKENIWTFNLSVNLSELMFFRRKLN